MDSYLTDEGSVVTDEFSKEDLKSWIEDYEDDHSITFSDDYDFDMSSETQESECNVIEEESVVENLAVDEEKFINYQYYKYQYGVHISEHTSRPIMARDAAVACEVQPGSWPPGIDVMLATELDIVTMILETISGYQNDLFLRIFSPNDLFVLTHTARHIALPTLSSSTLNSLLSRVALFASQLLKLRAYMTSISSRTGSIGLDACSEYYRATQCTITVTLQHVVSGLDSQVSDMSLSLAGHTKAIEQSPENLTPLPVTLLSIALLLSKWDCVITSMTHVVGILASSTDASPVLLRALHTQCSAYHLLETSATLPDHAPQPSSHELRLQLSLAVPSIYDYSHLMNSLYTSLLTTYLSKHIQHIWSGGQSDFSIASDNIMRHLDSTVAHLVAVYSTSTSDVHLMSRYPQGLKLSSCFASSRCRLTIIVTFDFFRDFLRGVHKAISALQLCLRTTWPSNETESEVYIDVVEMTAHWQPYPVAVFSNIADWCGKPSMQPVKKETARSAVFSSTPPDNSLYPLASLMQALVVQPLIDVLSSLQMSAMQFYHHQYHLQRHLHFFRDVFLLSDSSIFTPLRELTWTIAMADDIFTYDIFDTIRANILSRFPDSDSKCTIPYRSSSNHQSLQHIYEYAAQFAVEVYFVYPLNELFHDASILRTYSTCMRRLLQLYACIWIIEGVWKKLSSTNSNLAQLCKAHELQSELARRMFVLRNRCMIRLSWVLYMLKGIQFYYMNTIHSEIYDAFLADAIRCPSISEFRDIHATTLHKINVVLSLESDTISDIMMHCISSVVRLDEANSAADVYSGFAHTMEEQNLVAASLELANSEFDKLWTHVHRLHVQLKSIARRRSDSMFPEYALRMKGLIGDVYI